MKRYLIALIVLNCLNSFAFKTDTIAVTFNKTTLLVFDSKIVFDDLGNPDELSIAKDNNKIKLTAGFNKPFAETTLFVETETGYYSFILVWSKSPKKLFHTYNFKQSVYNKNEVAADTVKTEVLKVDKRFGAKLDANYFKNCSEIVDKSNSIKGIGVIDKRLAFLLGDICIENDDLYFKLIIRNNSNINYDIALLKFVVRHDKGVIKKKAEQETVLEPKYILNENTNTVLGKNRVVKVYVFPKFTFDSDKKLYIELWEQEGERIVDFPVTSQDILNVKPLH